MNKERFEDGIKQDISTVFLCCCLYWPWSVETQLIIDPLNVFEYNRWLSPELGSRSHPRGRLVVVVRQLLKGGDGDGDGVIFEISLAVSFSSACAAAIASIADAKCCYCGGGDGHVRCSWWHIHWSIVLWMAMGKSICSILGDNDWHWPYQSSGPNARSTFSFHEFEWCIMALLLVDLTNDTPKSLIICGNKSWLIEIKTTALWQL